MDPVDRRRSALDTLLPVLLLGVMVALQVTSMAQLSSVSDEVVHLMAGYAQWTTGSLQVNPQHPPLVKLLCALPLLWAPSVVDTQSTAWVPEPSTAYVAAHQWLYAQDVEQVLFWCRLPAVLLSVVLALYVWRWASLRFGRGAGWLALFLCAWCPNLLAHARYVTTDVGGTAFLVMTHFHLWRLLRTRHRGHLLATGMGLGLALAAKFSSVIALATVPGILLAALWMDPALRSTWFRWSIPVVLLIAAVVVWITYGCPWDWRFYLDGMFAVNADRNADYKYFLQGEFSTEGWWSYFLWALLYKTPVVTLALLGLTLLGWRRLPRGSVLEEACLVLPALVMLVVVSTRADALGVRYVLLVYPCLFVFISRVVPVLTRTLAARVASACAGIYLAASMTVLHPDYLGYFNEIAGGPWEGHRYLDDSNIDWGDGLKRLGAYLKEHDIDRVRLAYTWKSNPAYWGIAYDDATFGDLVVEPRPGVYAVSTQVYIRLPLMERPPGSPPPWVHRHEPTDRVGTGFFIYRVEGRASVQQDPENQQQHANTEDAQRGQPGDESNGRK